MKWVAPPEMAFGADPNSSLVGIRVAWLPAPFATAKTTAATPPMKTTAQRKHFWYNVRWLGWKAQKLRDKRKWKLMDKENGHSRVGSWQAWRLTLWQFDIEWQSVLTRPDTRHKMRLVCVLFTFENNTGRTYGQIDGQTDRPTDWRMDTTSYRAAMVHLKSSYSDVHCTGNNGNLGTEHNFDQVLEMRHRGV